MWNNVVVVDVHAHMSTPPEFGAVVNTMVALNTPNQRFSLTDESLDGALQRHLRVMDERSIDFPACWAPTGGNVPLDAALPSGCVEPYHQQRHRADG